MASFIRHSYIIGKKYGFCRLGESFRSRNMDIFHYSKEMAAQVSGKFNKRRVQKSGWLRKDIGKVVKITANKAIKKSETDRRRWRKDHEDKRFICPVCLKSKSKTQNRTEAEPHFYSG